MPTNRNRNSIGNHARTAVNEIQREAQTIGQFAQDSVHDLSETALERARGLQHQVEDRIVDNPVKAILVAAGVGVLLGLMCRR